jgi:hypothetical protein
MNGLRLTSSEMIGLAVMELGKGADWYGPALLSMREWPEASKEPILDMMLSIWSPPLNPFTGGATEGVRSLDNS